MSRRLPDPTTEPTIRVTRAAEIADVSVRTAYAACERGDWPSIKVGRSVRVPTARFLRQLGLEDGATAA